MGYYQRTFSGTDGIALNYQAWHPTESPRAVIVGVHGLGDHSGGLKNIIDHLLCFNYAWYGMDLQGHGYSQGQRGHIGTWSHYQNDLSTFVDIVIDREKDIPVFILGHSLGGLIVLEFAIRAHQGINGAIAVSPALDFNGIGTFSKIFLNLVSVVNPLYATTLKSEIAKLTSDPVSAFRLMDDSLRHNKFTAGLLHEMARGQFWVNKNGKMLKIPTLMLHGQDDTITRSNKTQRLYESINFSKKEYHELKHAGHRPFDDLNRAQVLDQITSWLEHHIGQPES